MLHKGILGHVNQSSKAIFHQVMYSDSGGDMKHFIPVLFLLSLLTISCEQSEYSEMAFTDFLNHSYADLLKTRPELVTELGMDDELGMSGRELNSWDEADMASREKLETDILRSLQSFDLENLLPEERLSYKVYEAYLQDLVDRHPYRRHSYLLSYMITSVNISTERFFSEIIPVTNREEADNYIARLYVVRDKMVQIDRQLEIQENHGITLPSVLYQATLNSIRSVSRQKSVNCSFYTAFQEKLKGLSLDQEETKRFLTRAEEACRDSVIPGYKILEERLISQQASAVKETGVSHLPEGGEYYSLILKHHTNSDIPPERIHKRGQEELERIHIQMRRLFHDLGYDDTQSISALFRKLNENEKILSGQQVLEEHERLIDRAKDWMAPHFSRFPHTEAEVKGDRRGGFYIPPSLDGSRPGVFYASFGSVGKFTLPTLTFHETYPGHHYQIALAGEAVLPLFRRQAMFTGYLEGWALYAEYLMDRTGFYEDDIPGRLGYLQAQAFRAARLVVDTGLHMYNWSISEAVSYFAETTGFDQSFARHQVYRYLVWPGQAASYYTGFLEFRDLLKLEEDRLGDDFDYAVFHEAILSAGPMPLTTLKEEIFHYD